MSTTIQEFRKCFPSIATNINDSSLDIFIAIADEKTFSTGDRIVHDNSANDHLFFVLEGRLESFIEKNNEKIELGELKSGDIAGEISMFGECPTTATVVASTDCKLLSINRTDLNQLKTTAPAFVNQLLRNISHTLAIRLLDADKLLYDRFVSNADEQVPKHHSISNLVTWCTSMYQQMHGHKEA